MLVYMQRYANKLTQDAPAQPPSGAAKPGTDPTCSAACPRGGRDQSRVLTQHAPAHN